MEVPSRDIRTVLLGHHLERLLLRAVAALVGEIRGLDFPVLDRAPVLVAARGELVTEVELWLGERRQRLIEQRGLLLVDEVRDFLLVFVGLGDRLDLKAGAPSTSATTPTAT